MECNSIYLIKFTELLTTHNQECSAQPALCGARGLYYGARGLGRAAADTQRG